MAAQFSAALDPFPSGTFATSFCYELDAPHSLLDQYRDRGAM
jgi:hypothetical protein